ncbi:MAG: glycerol kinase GlpK [Bosea sp. (in: a-proteobacteria)]
MIIEAQERYVMALDQGTTSTRAILFRPDATIAAVAQKEFAQHYPASGWVEHDAEDIWASAVSVMRSVMRKVAAKASQIAAMGITNQRETTVIWDRANGKPIANAIVWQDRRTADICHHLQQDGNEALVRERTGLLLDPYFSGTKGAWLLDNVPGARARAQRGELAFGTIDSFLIWRLTGGRVHATDATNASRTMLLNIHNGSWDADLLKLLRVPPSLLPQVRDCTADYGVTEPKLLGGAIAIRGVAGDQQAATVGQACFEPGMMKSTYGTGCFALLNTGEIAIASRNRLLTTIAYQFGGKRTYALEGAIFMAGATVQWLRDGLRLIKRAADTGPMAEAADPAQSVVMVPAFVGLGAPYWDPDARGAIFGMTRNTGPNELALAALEAVCFQTRDLLDAMKADWSAERKTVLRVDGGMTASDWTMQRLADTLDAPVDRPKVMETTALGAAYLAGLASGFYPEPATFAKRWRLDRRFSPTMPPDRREARYALWQDAVRRTRSKLT